MKNKFTAILNNLFLNKLFVSNKIVSPRRDWIILMSIFLIMVISVIIFDYVIYSKISNGEMYVSINRSELNLENLKTANLNKLIENFDAKVVTSSNLKIGSSIDPSI